MMGIFMYGSVSIPPTEYQGKQMSHKRAKRVRQALGELGVDVSDVAYENKEPIKKKAFLRETDEEGALKLSTYYVSAPLELKYGCGRKIYQQYKRA